VQGLRDLSAGLIERQCRQRGQEGDEQQQFVPGHQQDGGRHQVRRLPGQQEHRRQRDLRRRRQDQGGVDGHRRHQHREHHAHQQGAAQEPPGGGRVAVAQVGPRDAGDAVAPGPTDHEAAEHERGLDRIDRRHQCQGDEHRDGVEDPADVEPARARRGGQLGRWGRCGRRLGGRPVRPGRPDLALRQRHDVRDAEHVAGDAVVDPLALQDDRRLENVDRRRDRVVEHRARVRGLRVVGHACTSTAARRARQVEGFFAGACSR
jgi:hypothetical protein